MNCPCEILVHTQEVDVLKALLAKAVQEAARIENKFSRYRRGNIVDQINTAGGRTVSVDEETASLLDYASQCFELSEGLFDITTGILRKAWIFDGGDHRLDAAALDGLKAQIGWNRVHWKKPCLQLPTGFEIDFGGICKEYAADRILKLLREDTDCAVLVNMGGDIAAAGDHAWAIGVEDPRTQQPPTQSVMLKTGGVATSGSTRRYTQLEGRKLSHILNPKTGWPVMDPPLAVTVAASSCTEAGLWSTLAMLHGRHAESFLKSQALAYWCIR